MADKNVNFDAIFGDGQNNSAGAKKVNAAPKAGDYELERQEREGHSGCLGGIMYFVFVISISVVLACLAWMAATDVLALNAPDTVATITLPKSAFSEETYTDTDEDGNKIKATRSVADIGTVADILKDNGIIQYKWLFKLYCGFSHASQKIDPGTYELKAIYDYRAIVKKMQTGSNAMVTISITFPEGYTLDQICRKLEEEGVCSYDDLMESAANDNFTYSFLEGAEAGDASRLEGFLFPDTYEFYEGMQASTALNRLLEGFYYKLTAEMLENIDASGYSIKQIITVASMIEKEAANDDERAAIASVIYNRIKSDMYLNIDSTILYEYPDHEGGPTADMLKKDTAYNTYTRKGLPATPICSPGLQSILAAISPAETEYYYYALDTETGTHRFFKNAEEFNAFVATQNYE